ncbi:hypothetical protein L9F63_027902, partial [Diploptera punctata]
ACTVDRVRFEELDIKFFIGYFLVSGVFNFLLVINRLPRLNLFIDANAGFSDLGSILQIFDTLFLVFLLVLQLSFHNNNLVAVVFLVVLVALASSQFA